MEIDSVHVEIPDASKKLGFLASVSISIRGALGRYCVHGIKVVRDRGGRVIVAMPSQKLLEGCHNCGHRNNLAARYCNWCGIKKPCAEGVRVDPESGREITHADVFHPLDQTSRVRLEGIVLQAYADKIRSMEVRNAGTEPTPE